MDERTSWLEVDDEREITAPPPPLMCVRCYAIVTSPDEAIAVSGAHAHRCINPEGHLFDIRCFREAWGTIVLTPPETWFSWFRGHTWQTVACASCRHHLGWRFDGPSTFYGLIGSALHERRSAA